MNQSIVAKQIGFEEGGEVAFRTPENFFVSMGCKQMPKKIVAPREGFAATMAKNCGATGLPRFLSCARDEEIVIIGRILS